MLHICMCEREKRNGGVSTHLCTCVHVSLFNCIYECVQYARDRVFARVVEKAYECTLTSTGERGGGGGANKHTTAEDRGI